MNPEQPWKYLPTLAGAEGDETEGDGDAAPEGDGAGTEGGGESTTTETETTTTTTTEDAAGGAPADGVDPLVAQAQAELYEGDVADLGDEDIERLVSAIDVEITETRAKAEKGEAVSLADVARLKAFRVVQKGLAAEATARVEAAAALLAELDEVTADVVTLPTADATAQPAAQAASPSAPPAPAAPPAPISDADRGAHTAAISAIRDRARSPQAPTDLESPAAKVASPGMLARRVPWSPLQPGAVGDADFGQLLNSTRPSRSGGRHIQTRDESILAAAVIEADPELQLTDSQSHNEKAMSRLIKDHREARRAAADAVGAKTAAICSPAQIVREAMQCGTDATPLQGALVNANAVSGSNNNLHYSYRRPVSISEASAGVTSWTTDDQDDVDPTDPTTWKPCVAIACPGYAETIASEFTACFEVDAFTELSSPEQVADFEQAKDRAFARYTEAWFLRELDKFLYNVNTTASLGAVPDVINAELTAMANGHYAERMELEDYVAFGSPALASVLAIDENSRAYNTAARSMDDVLGIVKAATGTDYVQLLDLALATNGALPASPFGSLGTIGAASPTSLPTIGGGTFQYTIRLIDPSAFVGFNTGEATFGQQITLDQARRNQRGFFQRVFGGLMKPGCAPGYKINMTLCHDGSRGGFVEPTCGGASSAS